MGLWLAQRIVLRVGAAPAAGADGKVEMQGSSPLLFSASGVNSEPE
jgi:hypothetical protein